MKILYGMRERRLHEVLNFERLVHAVEHSVAVCGPMMTYADVHEKSVFSSSLVFSDGADPRKFACLLSAPAAKTILAVRIYYGHGKRVHVERQPGYDFCDEHDDCYEDRVLGLECFRQKKLCVCIPTKKSPRCPIHSPDSALDKKKRPRPRKWPMPRK